jgi:hypothetical protein
VGVTEEERPLLSAFTFEELHAELTRRAAILANVPEASLLAELSRRDQTLTGVQAIATFCGYSPLTIHRWAQQDVDPLPHGYDMRGKMTAKKSALAAWLGRRTSKLATKGKKARTVKPIAKAKRRT